MNILKYAVSSTPLGVLGKQFRTDWAAGGIRKAEAISKIATTTGLMTWGWSMYQNGTITGRIPARQKNSADSAGRQEYSIKLGNGRWYAYDRMDPLGMLLGLSADFAQLIDRFTLKDIDESEMERLEEPWTAIIMTLSSSTLNKTYMQSLREVVQLIDQPDKIGDTQMVQIGISQGRKLVPASSLWGSIQDMRDDVTRQAYEILDGWYALADSRQINAKRHVVYGYPLEKSFGLLKEKLDLSQSDRVMKEIMMLNVDVKPFDRSVSMSVSGTQVRQKLTKDAYNKLWDIYERLDVKPTLERIIDSPAYQRLGSPAKKRQILSNVISEFKQMAKDRLKSGRTDVHEELVRKARNRALAIAGALVEENALDQMLHLQK